MPLLAPPFRVASRLRGARIFHPRGVAVRATWQPAEAPSVLSDSPLLADRRAALLRVSHGIGLPAGLPDVLGVAVKVLDVHGPGADQDLLLASSGRGRLGRHLLRPTRALTGTLLSTLLPYELAGGGRGPIVCGSVPGATRRSYAEVVHDPARLPAFEVRVGGADGPLLGTVEPQEPVATELAEAIRFDPWNTGPELRPAGWVNRIRRPTYAASQDGRGAPAGGWRGSIGG